MLTETLRCHQNVPFCTKSLLQTQHWKYHSPLFHPIYSMMSYPLKCRPSYTQHNTQCPHFMGSYSPHTKYKYLQNSQFTWTTTQLLCKKSWNVESLWMQSIGNPHHALHTEPTTIHTTSSCFAFATLYWFQYKDAIYSFHILSSLFFVFFLLYGIPAFHRLVIA
jgi:hypothetical protein